jgi:lysozyme family protein
MRATPSISRRAALRTLGGAIAAPALVSLPLGRAWAQTSQSPRAAAAAAAANGQWRELGALNEEASRLGFATPRLSATLGASGGDEYGPIMRTTVGLIDQVETSPTPLGATPEDVERLLRKSSALLRRVHQAERMPRQDRRNDGDPNAAAAAAATRPTLDALRDEYTRLFSTCVIREKNRAAIMHDVGRVLDSRNQQRWVAAAQETCIPWYFIGLIHSMEGAIDFRAHLHNGDPLSEKTVQVPANRPPKWNPPSDWTSSAIDSLTYEGFANQADWSIAATLYRLERNNGFGSRRNGINTPYLWSFSNHYSRGKFTCDGCWDPDAVSKQVGAAVILKVMVDQGNLTLPA